MESFSKNLKKLRMGENKFGRKFTQQEVASGVDVARSLISDYENGNKEPTLSVLLRIAEFFGVSLDELCN